MKPNDDNAKLPPEFMRTFHEWVKSLKIPLNKKGQCTLKNTERMVLLQKPGIWQYGLNKDVTMKPHQGEGEKLRDKKQ